ncbi:MAG TPA: flagellar biosynthetic protein FliR [Conexibacter sp.]|nr:flagellar biosynthetic protein FliR [Conexibacter sp.]
MPGAAPLDQVLAQFGGMQTAGFILVLARITPLFFVAPLFSSKQIPPRVRTIVAVALAVGLTPIAMRHQQIPNDVLTLFGLVLKELLVGLAFALSIGLLFAAVSSAGAILDMLVGFSFGSIVDPLTGNQSAVLTQLYGLVALAVFVVIDGIGWVVGGLSRTFELVPLTAAPDVAALATGVISTFTTIFTSALEVAAPVLLACVITDVAFGVVTRVVPQLNVFAVGFPVKVVVGLLVVGASLPFVSGWISDQLQLSVAQALQTIKLAG